MAQRKAGGSWWFGSAATQGSLPQPQAGGVVRSVCPSIHPSKGKSLLPGCSCLLPQLASVLRPHGPLPPLPGRRTWASPAQLQVRMMAQLLHQLLLRRLLQDVPVESGRRCPGSSGERETWAPPGGRAALLPTEESSDTCTTEHGDLGPSPGCVHGVPKSPGGQPSTLAGGAVQRGCYNTWREGAAAALRATTTVLHQQRKDFRNHRREVRATCLHPPTESPGDYQNLRTLS